MVVMLNQEFGRSEECSGVERDPKVVDALK